MRKVDKKAFLNNFDKGLFLGKLIILFLLIFKQKKPLLMLVRLGEMNLKRMKRKNKLN